MPSNPRSRSAGQNLGSKVAARHRLPKHYLTQQACTHAQTSLCSLRKSYLRMMAHTYLLESQPSLNISFSIQLWFRITTFMSTTTNTKHEILLQEHLARINAHYHLLLTRNNAAVIFWHRHFLLAVRKLFVTAHHLGDCKIICLHDCIQDLAREKARLKLSLK
jgi:hypothetical protein